MSSKKSVQHLLIEKIIRRNMVADDLIQNIVAAGGALLVLAIGKFMERGKNLDGQKA